MIIEGRVWKFGDDVGATSIVASEHDALGMSRNWTECAKHLFAASTPRFAADVRAGDLIVAGRNFGSGHAHYYTTAIMAAKTAGIAGFFVESISGLFQRAAIDFGMPAWPLPGITDVTEDGDRLQVELDTGVVRNLTRRAERRCPPVPRILLDILEAGGSRNWALRRVGAEHAIASAA